MVRVKEIANKLELKISILSTALFLAMAALQTRFIFASDIWSKGTNEVSNVYTNLKKLALPVAAVVAVVGIIGYFATPNQQKASKRIDNAIKAVVCYGVIMGLGFFFAWIVDVTSGAPDVLSIN